MGSVYARLGTEITVVEFMDRITPGLDGEISAEFQKVLTKQGFKFMLSSKVVGARKEGDRMVVDVEDVKSGKKSEINACKVLLAVGRRPYTEGLGLENIGVEKDKVMFDFYIMINNCFMNWFLIQIFIHGNDVICRYDLSC